MTIVQRQSKAITSNMLLVEDPDNSPDQLVYDVINSPTNGHLVYAENLTRSVARFSQGDIDNERIIYTHDGTQKTVEFYFRVSDQKHKPVFRHFRFVVSTWLSEMEAR